MEQKNTCAGLGLSTDQTFEHGLQNQLINMSTKLQAEDEVLTGMALNFFSDENHDQQLASGVAAGGKIRVSVKLKIKLISLISTC